MILLTTKLYRPGLPARRVVRPRLMQRLNAGLEAGRRLTLISAPAGFGKSLCAAEWISSLTQPVAWLALDRQDDEPMRFFSYLVAALQQVDAALGYGLDGILRAGQLPAPEIISTMLINNILSFKHELVVVLDDVQVLQESAILNALEQLIANQPPNLHLVMLAREDPALALARLRANNQLTELRAADLRFADDEVHHFLNEVMGLRLSVPDIAILEEKTEGWIAGLQLAALSLRDRTDHSHFIATLSGSQRHIVSYLTEEVLRGQPEDIRLFLLQTSILERLNADLCNMVTQRTDSQRVLERLLVTNLFLIPLDDQQHWYRYHHLFADLLRSLQHSYQQAQIDATHLRASQWYANAGMINEAIQHALAASDYARIVELIERHAVELLIQGYASTLTACLQVLPAAWSLHSPRVSLAFAWMYVMRGRVDQAAPFVERLRTIFSSSQAFQDDVALQAQWLAFQAFLLAGQGNTGESMNLATEAVSIAPIEDSYVQGLAYHALATVWLVSGDYTQAVETYQKAILYSRASGHFAAEMLGIAALIQIALQHGRLSFAFGLASQGIERVEQEGIFSPISAALYASVGHIHYIRYQLEQARPYYLRAIQLSPLSAYSDTEIGYELVQSRMLQVEGDLEAATAALQRALKLKRMAPPVWVNEEIIAQQVRIALAHNQLAEAEAALQSQGFFNEGRLHIPDVAAEQAMTPALGWLYSSTLRIQLYRAQSQKHAASLEHNIDLTRRLSDAALQRGYIPTAVTLLLLGAQIHAALGKHSASLDDIRHALELAEPEGMISSFVEEGLQVATLLTELLAQPESSRRQKTYIQQILTAFSEHHQHPSRNLPHGAVIQAAEGLPEPLSNRELEILRLIAEGCSNQLIAERLVLSSHTVKKHISNIFSKLDVTSRTQALALARQLKLL